MQRTYNILYSVLGENGMIKNRPLRTGSIHKHIGRVRRKNGSPDRFQQDKAHCVCVHV